MTRLVAFDLDGTLVDTLNDLADSTNYAMNQLGFSASPVEDFRWMVGNGVDLLLKRALPEDQKENAETLKKAKALFNEYYHQNYCNKTVPYKGIPELLHALKEKGIEVAVLSNKPDEFVSGILSTLLPDVSFAYVTGARSDFPKKPAPDLLHDCLDKLSLKAEECLYCGDSDVDVLFAHNAGMKVAGAAWGFRGREELLRAGCEYLLEEPNDLQMYINT